MKDSIYEKKSVFIMLRFYKRKRIRNIILLQFLWSYDIYYVASFLVIFFNKKEIYFVFIILYALNTCNLYDYTIISSKQASIWKIIISLKLVNLIKMPWKIHDNIITKVVKVINVYFSDVLNTKVRNISIFFTLKIFSHCLFHVNGHLKQLHFYV